ncbi:F-BAR and double SH3 domains protein 2-like isoform X2 [Zophobas morio]|uniref:F-BAR and double SH3 domains protein 2-like isoform X2 n=1 Tax=Zophobas morio TaxID=2755281 RepID=UPI003083B53E
MESMSTKIIRRNHYVPETVQERKTQAEHLKLLTIKSQRDIELLEEAREYFKKRAQIEAEYSKNLRSLASTHLSKPLLEDLIAESRNKITVASSFKRILDETVNLADRHNDMSLSFSNQLVEAFKNKIILKKNLIKRITAAHLKLQEHFYIQQQQLEKLKKYYEDMEKVYQIAESSYNDLEKKLTKDKKGFSTLKVFHGTKAEVEKRVKKAYAKMMNCLEKAHCGRNSYILFVEELNAQLNTYYQETCPQILSDLDDDYYSSCQNFFLLFSELLHKDAEATGSSCFVLKAIFDSIDRRTEEDLFLSKNIFKRENYYKFIPVNFDEITSIVNDETTKEHLNKFARQCVIHYNKAQGLYEKHIKELEALRGLSDFSRENMNTEANEDMIRQIIETRETAILATYDMVRAKARMEYLSGHGVSIPHESEVQSNLDNFLSTSRISIPRGSVKGKSCTVLYDYKGVEQDELSIVEDEVLTVVDLAEDGWCLCRNQEGREGLVPLSYIEIGRFSSPALSVHSSLQSSDTPEEPIKYATAQYEYLAETPDELSFHKGDVIEILNTKLSDVDDGWWEGRLNGKVGVFPSVLCEIKGK